MSSVTSRMTAVDIVEETHPVQIAALTGVFVFDVIALVVINRRKDRKTVSKQSDSTPWSTRRNAYWALITLSISTALLLDVHFDISPVLIPAKAYAFAFPVGLLDLHFSQTSGVPLLVLIGAMLWCSTVYLRQVLVDMYTGGHGVSTLRVVRDLGVCSVATEMLRYITCLPIFGILSDLIFSPMHRLAHHPSVYKGHHKVHHEYTNHLTSLVLYHGALLDDFLMPLTTTVGGVLYVLMLGFVGLEDEAFSSFTNYLIVFNTLLSHAHDTRCARLMAPLPDGLNFVAYHYVHHLSPSCNYGLTEPSDMLWDKLLGVNTIKKLADFELKQA